MRSVRRFLAAFALVALVAAPASAVTNERVDQVDSSYAPAMMDVLVLRPVGLIGLGLSAILYVPAQLMTLAVNPTVPVSPRLCTKKPGRLVPLATVRSMLGLPAPDALVESRSRDGSVLVSVTCTG